MRLQQNKNGNEFATGPWTYCYVAFQLNIICHNIYVIASSGGDLHPNITRGIFHDIVAYVNSQSRSRSRSRTTRNESSNISLDNILSYLENKNYTRVILIDYSCNVATYSNQFETYRVPRNAIIRTRERSYSASASKRQKKGGKNKKLSKRKTYKKRK